MSLKQQRIVLGVAGVRRKLDRKPMQAILHTLRSSDPRFHLVLMDERDMQQPISAWPTVHALLTMHSSDFPLDTVLQYVALRSPFLVNNIHMQRFLMDRTLIRGILSRAGVPIPTAACLHRSAGDYAYQPDPSGDTLVIHSPATPSTYTVHKPFVEKPVAANDHNVYIYYKGGGIRRLFRKEKNKSSVFDPHVRQVRQSGDFIYERFYQPEHRADVKVYAVGDYFHAESRKAPHIDGIVERDPHGRERRTPVILSEEELRICRRVTSAFDQYVIGFDLLRGTDSRRFVIDVNGWSVVKNSDEYTTRAGQLLAKYVLENIDGPAPDESQPSPSNIIQDASRPPNLFDPTNGQRSPCPV